MPTLRESFLAVVAVLSLACGEDAAKDKPADDPSGLVGEGGAGGSSGAGGSAEPAIVDKAAPCTDTFGNGVPKGFSRIDGTVLAIVQPKKDTGCPGYNGDHLVLEVTANGEHYRMVVNVASDRPDADPRVGLATVAHGLLAPPYAEGFHDKLGVDYPTDLQAHDADFTPYELAELSQRVTDALTLGAPVSVYASSETGGSSAHKIHRNKLGEDGAIVVDPNGPNPQWLLFRFQNQSF